VEPAWRPHGGRCSARSPLGARSSQFRPGWLRLHGTGIRVRLEWSIIGPDLVWRDNGWVSVRQRNKDPDFRSRKTVADHDFARLARNVYKVLLTRGMIGTAIYSTDAETRAMLRSLVPDRQLLRTPARRHSRGTEGVFDREGPEAASILQIF
jgi:hypothetical protein